MEVITYSKYNALESGLSPIILSATPLGASGSVTSVFVKVDSFSRLQGTAFADVDGTLTLEFSQDGTNVDYSSTYSVTGGDTTTTGFDQIVIAKFVRAKFETINAQTTFRLTINGREVS